MSATPTHRRRSQIMTVYISFSNPTSQGHYSDFVDTYLLKYLPDSVGGLFRTLTVLVPNEDQSLPQTTLPYLQDSFIEDPAIFEFNKRTHTKHRVLLFTYTATSCFILNSETTQTWDSHMYGQQHDTSYVRHEPCQLPSCFCYLQTRQILICKIKQKFIRTLRICIIFIHDKSTIHLLVYAHNQSERPFHVYNSNKVSICLILHKMSLLSFLKLNLLEI